MRQAENALRSLAPHHWCALVHPSLCGESIWRELPDIDTGIYLPFQIVSRVDRSNVLKLRHRLPCTSLRWVTAGWHACFRCHRHAPDNGSTCECTSLG